MLYPIELPMQRGRTLGAALVPVNSDFRPSTEKSVVVSRDHFLADGGAETQGPTTRALLRGPGPRALAETEGFEPSIQLLTVYTLSRRAPSATRPCLHLCTRPVGSNVLYPASASYVSARTHTLLSRFSSQPYEVGVRREEGPRRRRDSNPRDSRLAVFKTAAFNHSATPPPRTARRRVAWRL